MLIDCPGCGKSYHIIKAALGPTGRRVACPRCDAVWFVASDEGGAAAAGPDQDLAFEAAISIVAASGEARFPALSGVVPPARFSPYRFSPAQPMPAASARRRRPVLTEMFLGVALIALAMSLIGFRTGIVWLWPRVASVYAVLGLPVNLRGLALEHFHTVTTNDGFQTVLGIEGEIANLRARATKIPPLRLAIRDGQGHILYSWLVAAPKQRLAASEILAFRAKLAAPPAAGRDVLVSFTAAPSRKSLAFLWNAAWHF